MDAPSRIPFHLERARKERPLFTDKDVKVIIRGVQTRMTLRAQGGTKDNEVLRDTCMDDVHRAHGTASIAEDPLFGVSVEPNLCCGVCSREISDYMLDHSSRVIG